MGHLWAAKWQGGIFLSLLSFSPLDPLLLCISRQSSGEPPLPPLSRPQPISLPQNHSPSLYGSFSLEKCLSSLSLSFHGDLTSIDDNSSERATRAGPFLNLFWLHESNGSLIFDKQVFVENHIFWGMFDCLDLCEISIIWYSRLCFGS